MTVPVVLDRPQTRLRPVCRPLSCPVGCRPVSCQLSSAATHGPNGMSTIRRNDNQARAERGLALMLAPAVLLLAVPPAGRRGPAGTAWSACTAQAVAVAAWRRVARTRYASTAAAAANRAAPAAIRAICQPGMPPTTTVTVTVTVTVTAPDDGTENLTEAVKQAYWLHYWDSVTRM